MTALSAHPPRSRLRSRVDHASLLLLRAVMSDTWDAGTAGRDLALQLDHDRLLLDLLRARVARKLLARPTQIDVRAQATLDEAVSRAVEHALVVPVQPSGAARA